MIEKRRASKDRPGTVQLGNEKRMKTQLHGEAGQEELRPHTLRSKEGTRRQQPNKEKVGLTAKL